ncbi:MAG: hypothetical protein V3V00_02455 [Saprospiraceae bacterium]
MSQIVDTESAQEFMKEALNSVTIEELEKISKDLEIKHKAFANMLVEEKIDTISEEELLVILRYTFPTRRAAKTILENNKIENLRALIKDLIYGQDEVNMRFQRFYDNLINDNDNLKFGFAGELLHFTKPNKYWLWTRWIWDPKNKTGSLSLVTTEDFDMNADSVGESYMKVGKATAFVHHTGEAAGFQNISRTLFGTDVYLCCVYVIYTYTVLRMRMTQEFNKVIPGLPEFSRRLLGVQKMEEYQLAN